MLAGHSPCFCRPTAEIEVDRATEHFLFTCVLHNVSRWMRIWSPEWCAIHSIGAMFEKPVRWLSKKWRVWHESKHRWTIPPNARSNRNCLSQTIINYTIARWALCCEVARMVNVFESCRATNASFCYCLTLCCVGWEYQRRDSSVGRASDWRSEVPRFDPGSRHFVLAGCEYIDEMCVCMLEMASANMVHGSECENIRNSFFGHHVVLIISWMPGWVGLVLGRDFNSRGMETCRGSIPPLRRFHICFHVVFIYVLSG